MATRQKALPKPAPENEVTRTRRAVPKPKPAPKRRLRVVEPVVETEDDYEEYDEYEEDIDPVIRTLEVDIDALSIRDMALLEQGGKKRPSFEAMADLIDRCCGEGTSALLKWGQIGDVFGKIVEKLGEASATKN